MMIFGMDRLYTYLLRRDTYMKTAWIDGLKNTDYSFAFIGASRAYTMVNTPELERRWNKKGVNLSLDGFNILEQYLTLRGFYDNGNTTGDLFVELDITLLDSTMDNDFRIWCFLPYIDRDYVYQELQENFGRNRALRWKYLPFYRYSEFNSKLGPVTVANSVLGIIKPPYTKEGDWGGAYTGRLSAAGWKQAPYEGHVNPVQIKYLEKILSLSAKHGTRVHLYTAPIYYERYLAMTNLKQLIADYVLPLNEKYGSDYRSFCEMAIARNPDYFVDGIHMNMYGLPFLTDALAGSYDLDRHVLIQGPEYQ